MATTYQLEVEFSKQQMAEISLTVQCIPKLRVFRTALNSEGHENAEGSRLGCLSVLVPITLHRFRKKNVTYSLLFALI